MKKIGILTFHWADDFGAMLQAYGLKSFLQSEGYCVDIIPYSNSNLKGRYGFLPKQANNKKGKLFVGDYNIQAMFKNILNIRDFCEKKHRMNDFRKHYLTGKSYISNPLKLDAENYDIIIVGSDQVWNPELTIGLDEVYLGNIPRNEHCKVIAYSASFGKEKLSDEDGKKLGNAIDTYFSSVSLREQSAIPFLSNYTHAPLHSTPDPTLLPLSNQWHKMAENAAFSNAGKGYVVFHNTERNDNMFRFAEKLAQKTQNELLLIRELPTGPLEFLKMIKDADYVVTNSFHGTVFSILFEKQFVVFAHSDKNSRLFDLLKSVGLEERLSANHSLEVVDKEIDWEKVRQKTELLREQGKRFLLESIGE